MESLFEIVSRIELKKYTLFLDKHDIQDIIQYALKTVMMYNNGNTKALPHENGIFLEMYCASLIQILQKIELKKRTIKNLKHKKKLKFVLTPVEVLAMKKLTQAASFDDMPLMHCILEQLDKQ